MSEWRDPRDPPRWLDSEQLPDHVRRDLTAYAAEAPAAVRRGRMLGKLESELGLAATQALQSGSTAAASSQGGASAASKLALGAAGAGGSTLTLKLLLAALAGTVALLGVQLGTQQASSAPHASLLVSVDAVGERGVYRAQLPPTLPPAREASSPDDAASVRALASSSLPESSQPPSDSPSQHGPAPSRIHARRAPPARSIESVRPAAAASDRAANAIEELTLLARARRALLVQPARSLELAEQHAREFPNGTLNEEREVLAIESLLKLGLSGVARERARAFDQHFPSSAHRAHLARMISAPEE